MNLRKIFILVFCSCSVLAFGQYQDVISAAGNSFITSTGSIIYTIGESIPALSGDNVLIAHGFEQSLKPVGFHDRIYSDNAIKVYPNPAGDFVILKVEKLQDLEYRLFDLNGRLLLLGKIVNTESELDLSRLTPSLYILKLYRGKDVTAIYKIIKK